VLEVITHGVSEADIVDMYTSFPWPTLCEAVASLKVELPQEEAADDDDLEPMAGFEPATYGLRNR
jgi:hypothetical protein